MIRLESVKQRFKSILEETKAFLLRQRWKEALVFLFFVCLAFGFWILQSLQQEYEIQISIPIRYKNVPPNIAFVQPPPSEITAQVKDKGSVLLNYTIGRMFTSIDVNLKGMSDKKGVLSLTRKEIESNILKQLMATTDLLSFEPQQIEAPYSTRKQIKVPVEFAGDVRTALGYALSGQININPSTVDVYASQSLLDTLKSVKTVYTEILNGNNTLTKVIELQKIPGATIEPATVSVTIPIEEYTEKTLEIPVVCVGVPARYTIRTFPANVKVTCNIPLSRFKELQPDEFSIQIQFADIEQNVSGIIPVKLVKKPDWIGDVTLYPDSLEFLLEQNIHE